MNLDWKGFYCPERIYFWYWVTNKTWNWLQCSETDWSLTILNFFLIIKLYKSSPAVLEYFSLDVCKMNNSSIKVTQKKINLLGHRFGAASPFATRSVCPKGLLKLIRLDSKIWLATSIKLVTCWSTMLTFCS